METLQTYNVVREHYGDRQYAEGDTREALPSDVAHLVPTVLVLAEPIAIEDQPAPAPKPAKAPRKAKVSKTTE